MAGTCVFVDDAVRGTLPDVCAKDGVPATGRLQISAEVGRTARIGVLWLLVFAGPLGWLVIFYLVSRDSGERLTVEIPYSDEAYERFATARRLRNQCMAASAVLGVTMFVLTGAAKLGPPGFLLTFAAVVGPLVVALLFEWRMNNESIDVRLDASRRWVRLSGVHPTFAKACDNQHLHADRS